MNPSISFIEEYCTLWNKFIKSVSIFDVCSGLWYIFTGLQYKQIFTIKEQIISFTNKIKTSFVILLPYSTTWVIYEL